MESCSFQEVGELPRHPWAIWILVARLAFFLSGRKSCQEQPPGKFRRSRGGNVNAVTIMVYYYCMGCDVYVCESNFWQEKERMGEIKMELSSAYDLITVYNGLMLRKYCVIYSRSFVSLKSNV